VACMLRDHMAREVAVAQLLAALDDRYANRLP
jgi:hypothetical protein